MAGSGAATWTLCALCLCCGLQTCGLCEGWVVCILCADVIVCPGVGDGERETEEGVWVPAQVCV